MLHPFWWMTSRFLILVTIALTPVHIWQGFIYDALCQPFRNINCTFAVMYLSQNIAPSHIAHSWHGNIPATSGTAVGRHSLNNSWGDVWHGQYCHALMEMETFLIFKIPLCMAIGSDKLEEWNDLRAQRTTTAPIQKPTVIERTLAHQWEDLLVDISKGILLISEIIANSIFDGGVPRVRITRWDLVSASGYAFQRMDLNSCVHLTDGPMVLGHCCLCVCLMFSF